MDTYIMTLQKHWTSIQNSSAIFRSFSTDAFKKWMFHPQSLTLTNRVAINLVKVITRCNILYYLHFWVINTHKQKKHFVCTFLITYLSHSTLHMHDSTKKHSVCTLIITYLSHSTMHMHDSTNSTITHGYPCTYSAIVIIKMVLW